jgi:hypothetical protein
MTNDARTHTGNGSCCSVIELRQYTLKPGHRDALVDVFDRHLVESQEALGMTVVGQFRDRHRPDRFVWIRGFADMTSRHRALEGFYGGPVWAEHKDAANQTMLEWHDVRLLKPARPDFAFHLNTQHRPAHGEQRPGSLIVAGIHGLERPADEALVARFAQQAIPLLRVRGVHVDGAFVTEPTPNTFTRLPVREGEHELVWFGSLENESASAAPSGALLGESLTNAVASFGDRPPLLLELEPTSRSSLGHHRTSGESAF